MPVLNVKSTIIFKFGDFSNNVSFFTERLKTDESLCIMLTRIIYRKKMWSYNLVRCYKLKMSLFRVHKKEPSSEMYTSNEQWSVKISATYFQMEEKICVYMCKIYIYLTCVSMRESKRGKMYWVFFQLFCEKLQSKKLGGTNVPHWLLILLYFTHYPEYSPSPFLFAPRYF